MLGVSWKWLRSKVSTNTSILLYVATYDIFLSYHLITSTKRTVLLWKKIQHLFLYRISIKGDMSIQLLLLDESLGWILILIISLRPFLAYVYQWTGSPLSSFWHRVIIWINADWLSIGPLRTNINEINQNTHIFLQVYKYIYIFRYVMLFSWSFNVLNERWRVYTTTVGFIDCTVQWRAIRAQFEGTSQHRSVFDGWVSVFI